MHSRFTSIMNEPIGTVLFHARAFDFKLKKSHLMKTDVIKNVDVFFNNLHERKIDYVLVGGIALLNYIKGRNTQDIDFIIAAKDIANIHGLKVLSQQKPDYAQAVFEGLRIDFLLTENKFFQSVLQNHSTYLKIHNKKIRCATPVGLILLKLYALPALYREGNAMKIALYETDIQMLLLNYPVSKTKIFRSLKPHVLTEDMKSLKEVFDDILRRTSATRKNKFKKR